MNDPDHRSDPPTTPRRRGRPRVCGEPMLPLSTWISTATYDELSRLARQQGRSLSALVRLVLTKRLPPGPSR